MILSRHASDYPCVGAWNDRHRQPRMQRARRRWRDLRHPWCFLYLRAAGLAIVFKLLLAAEQSWRKLNTAELIALVRAGATLPMTFGKSATPMLTQPARP